MTHNPERYVKAEALDFNVLIPKIRQHLGELLICDNQLKKKSLKLLKHCFHNCL